MSYNPETNKWEYDYKKPFNLGWKWSANRRRHQRALNRAMKVINKDIEKDELWRGRFIVRSGATAFWCYPDKSGYDLGVELIFRDKRTNFEWRTNSTVNNLTYGGGSLLWRLMNKFITEEANVWISDGRDFLYSDTTNYTKIT